MLHLGLFVNTTTSGEEWKPKQVILVILYHILPSNNRDCDAAEWKSHRSKVQTLHIYPFMVNVMQVKLPNDLSVRRRWRAPFWRERKDKTGKKVEPQKKFHATSPSLQRGKRSALTATSDEPVYSAWNNWRFLICCLSNNRAGFN